MFVDNDMFMRFVHNDLSKEDMARVKESLIESNEIDAVLLTAVNEYLENPNPDDLIEEYEENVSFFEEKEKIFDDFWGKIKDDDYRLVLNHKNSTNMENFNFNFTKEMLETLANRYNEINSSADPTKSLAENLDAYYASLHPEFTQEEVHGIVQMLMKGTETLTEKYDKASKEGRHATVRETIKEACDKIEDIKQRFDFLVNALSVVESLNLSTFDELSDIKAEVEEHIKEYAEKTTNPTEQDCADLMEQLVDAIDNNTLVLAGSDKLTDLLQSAQNGTVQSIYFSSAQYDDACHKAEMALAAWIEIENENLDVPTEARNPEVIGVSVASAVEQQKILNDLSAHKINYDLASDCLQTLLGITISCVLSIIILSALALTVLAVSTAILLPCVGSFIIAALTVVVYVPFMYKMVQFAYPLYKETVEITVETCIHLYDHIRENVWPIVVESGKRFLGWCKQKGEDFIEYIGKVFGENF